MRSVTAPLLSVTTLLFSAAALSMMPTAVVAQNLEQRTRLATDHPDWFPDGSVVVSSNLTGSWQIWRVDPDGRFERLTRNDGQDDWPTVSPDGRLVAYASYRGDQNDIHVVDVVTGAETNLTTDGADDIHPTWSPDGSRILFNSTRDDPDHHQLYTMALDGSDVRRITEPGVTRTAASFSPDGTRIAHVVWGDDVDAQPEVWIMNADGTGERNLSAHPGFDGWPTWSPDGETIVFASNRVGWFQIWAVSPDGSDLRRLIRSPYNDRRPFFSPDGRRLSFDRETEEARNILIVEVAEGR
jgi:Tol biopolymer transport system component